MSERIVIKLSPTHCSHLTAASTQPQNILAHIWLNFSSVRFALSSTQDVCLQYYYFLFSLCVIVKLREKPKRSTKKKKPILNSFIALRSIVEAKMFASRVPILCRALKQLGSTGANVVKSTSPQLQSIKHSGSWTYRTGCKPHEPIIIIGQHLLGGCKYWFPLPSIAADFTNCFIFFQLCGGGFSGICGTILTILLVNFHIHNQNDGLMQSWEFRQTMKTN